jgi:hypothetical protein
MFDSILIGALQSVSEVSDVAFQLISRPNCGRAVIVSARDRRLLLTDMTFSRRKSRYQDVPSKGDRRQAKYGRCICSEKGRLPAFDDTDPPSMISSARCKVKANDSISRRCAAETNILNRALNV